MLELKKGDRIDFIVDGKQTSGTVTWFNPSAPNFGVKEDGVTYPRDPAFTKEDFYYLRKSSVCRIVAINSEPVDIDDYPL